jgi:HSP20 family molecular chaperone IbpA
VPVNLEGAAAQYKDGFLLIQLPKGTSNQIKVE